MRRWFNVPSQRCSFKNHSSIKSPAAWLRRSLRPNLTLCGIASDLLACFTGQRQQIPHLSPLALDTSGWWRADPLSWRRSNLELPACALYIVLFHASYFIFWPCRCSYLLSPLLYSSLTVEKSRGDTETLVRPRPTRVCACHGCEHLRHPHLYVPS